MTGFDALLPRPDVPYAANEATTLLAWLAYHRSTLAMKCDGLTEEQLKQRPIPTSTLSLLGLVRHWTDVERYWIRQILMGHESVQTYYTPVRPDGDFDDLHDTPADGVLKTWILEGQHTVAALGHADLDDICQGSLPRRAADAAAVRTWEDEGGSVRPEVPSVRWVLTHLIEEFARHNGHADLIRELIDGSTGE